MFIKEITLNNFRIYKGNNKISFTEDSRRNIYIIAGYNGYGKTTFLTSLVWCLYGRYMQDVDELFKKKIQEVGGYLEFLEACLNRNSKNSNDTNYSVTLKVSDLQIPGITAQEVEIKRSYSLGDRHDILEIKIDGHHNELVEDVGNDIFIQDFILPKEIAKFFFFDAEKIITIAEIQSLDQKKQLGSAYSEVLGIKKYIDLRNSLNDLRLKYKRESASPEELKKLELDELHVSKLEHEILQREQVIKEYNQDIEDKSKRSSELQEKLVREGSSISLEQLLVLKKEKATLIDRASEYKSRFDSMLDFAPFAIAGKLFFKLEQQLKLEQQYNKRRGFTLQEIKESINKINLSIKEFPEYLSKGDVENKINELLNQYFIGNNQEDIPNLDIQVLHEFDEQLHRSFSAIATNLSSTFKEQFRHLSRDIKRNRYELNEVNKKLSRAESKEGDILIQKHKQEKANIDNEINSIRNLIISISHEIGARTNELNTRKKVLQETRKKLSIKEDLLEKDITAERLIHELDEFILNIQQEKQATLQSRICTGLNKLMHKKDLIKRVSVVVDGEIIDIELFNDKDERIIKEDLSMGEKQLYATSILQALVEESNIEFPVFIDSPMQKLDATHAKNIITDFYPKVSKQVVILPLLNKEMTVEEFELFKVNVQGCYLIKNWSEHSSTFISVDNNSLFSVAAELDNKEEQYV
ncbi:AAA family ATPase [Spirosoma panaciterrae]|uniref:AAA family ATPase n=1 Tax=Spirosoma panaciterrae TaxID=496058 RepID=UPI00035CE6BD|nr:AAA family ATPase [Spirosoma panaciterrae]